MCRLVAYVGEPISATHIVFGGTHPLFRQSYAPRELLHGSVNADGWGVVWYQESLPVRLARAEPIWYDVDLPRVLGAATASVVVAALRNATPGLLVDRAGLLPLVHERWSFVLNGFVPRFRPKHMRALRATLPDDLYAQLAGSSDAETLFLRTLAAIRSGASLTEALEGVARAVHERIADGASTPLTMVMSDGVAIAVCHTSNDDRVNSLYTLDRGDFASGGALLASEPLDEDPDWKPVPPHTLVELTYRGATVRPLRT